MLGLALFLAACDSSEDRAERHYQSALALLEKGEVERAIIEFRNVFDLNGRHRAARADFAKLQRERGNISAAAGQYLRLVEQYPDDVPGNLALAEIYANNGEFAQMPRFIDSILAVEPDNKKAQALKVVAEYRSAVGAGETDRASELAAAAAEMRQAVPDYLYLDEVVIDDMVRHQRYVAALQVLDEAIGRNPDDQQLYGVRLSVLGAMGDEAAIEAQLTDMVDRFGDDQATRLTLVRWHVSQGDIDKAEAVLREGIAARADDPEARMILLQFLTELRGKDTAIAEIDRMIAAGNATPIFRALRAGLVFENGQTEAAIAEMRDLVATMPETDEADTIRVALAEMIDRVGKRDEAEEIVDAVLAGDKSHVAALKLKAEWLIEADRVGDAIVALRAALDQSPQDAEILTLMARAHQRDGNAELMGEMLSLAADASNKAPEESVRYANYLIDQQKFGPAEAVLIDALRLAPTDISVLTVLGRVYIGEKEWERGAQVVNTLRSLGSDEAVDAANELNVQLLSERRDIRAAVAFLEEMVAEGNADFDANVAIVRGYLLGGEPAKARDWVDRLVAETPDDRAVQFLDAAVDAAIGDLEGAEAKYRAMLASDDRDLQTWVALFRLLVANGKDAEAEAVFERAIAVYPDEPILLWIKASYLENAPDIEAAIAVYEDLYRRDSDNMVVANNLASLLSSWRTDPESLQRAFVISRRLRLSSVPPYQDTYGWIAYLRGEFDEAVEYLEPAARAMPGEPTVRYHLAKTYLAQGELADALQEFRQVLTLTTPADSRAFVVEARDEALRLERELASQVNE